MDVLVEDSWLESIPELFLEMQTNTGRQVRFRQMARLTEETKKVKE